MTPSEGFKPAASAPEAGRIERRMQALRASERKALIPFVTAGDPFADVTVELMHRLVEGGADVIELGVPFSDPMADGPVIQRASQRALGHGIGIARVLDMVREFRQRDASTPIVLMGYANPIERYGLSQFAQAAAEAGVDGVLIVDYPPEEAQAAIELCRRSGLRMIFLLAPTSTTQRIEKVAHLASGYVYYVSLAGVTGAAHLDVDDLARHLGSIRRIVSTPIVSGFGIRDADSACAVARHCDGVVIGSRIIELLEHLPRDRVAETARAFVASIRSALDGLGGPT
jgi:tryptophan synthase alpha chain